MTEWLVSRAHPGHKEAGVPLADKAPPLGPAAKLTDAERRTDFACSLFDWEKGWRDEGGSFAGTPGLYYDARAGFFRFGDSSFALSCEHADWRSLKEMGYFVEW